MSDPNTFSTPPSPFSNDLSTTYFDDEPLSTTPPSSSSSLSSAFSTISSLFPDVEVADHFLPDDDDDYYDDFIDNGTPLDDFVVEGPVANLSSSGFPCLTSNTSSPSSSSLPCLVSGDLTKTKIYSSADLWAENEIFARKLAPAMVFIAFLMIIGILGNAVVVYVYGLRFKSATQHFLIVCLACFDLIMCTVAMPTEIADIRFHHTFTSVFACKLLRFVTMFASISSSFTLVTVAYDRHRRITKPLSKQMSMKQARVWMVSNMMASLCFSWPTLVLTGIRTSETRISGLEGTDCSFSETFKKTKYPLMYNAVLGLGFFTLITVIAIFYFRIWKTAKTRKINMAKRYTIGSFSDQFMSELKLQRQISKDGMTEVLSKQLEKCVKEKLQIKPSIDCKDIYYFFETNSIRSTIGCEIAKKRGRSKGFSVSFSEGSSKQKRSDNSRVLGQSFTYRTSVNCRRRERNWEEDEEEKEEDVDEKRIGKVSKNRRYAGRQSSKLTKSFLMAKIPEQTSSSPSFKIDTLQVHGVGTSDIAAIKIFGSEEEEETSFQPCPYDNKNSNNINIDISDDDGHYNKIVGDGSRTTKKDNLVNVHRNKHYSTCKFHPSNSKCTCQRSRSNSPFLPLDNSDTDSNAILAPSPTLSLKSAATNSTLTSPTRYRRNSSPVIEGQGRRKSKLENSISVISDEFRPRPMSSLVDSVSQTLGRMQEFSTFGLRAGESMMESPSCTPRKGSRTGMATAHDRRTSRVAQMAVGEEDDNDDGGGGGVRYGTGLRVHKGAITHNTQTPIDCYPAHMGGGFESKDADSVYIHDCRSGNTNCKPDIYSSRGVEDEAKVEKYVPEDSGSRDNDNTNDKEVVLVPCNVSDDLFSFESFSHLIGSRSKPIEIIDSKDDDLGSFTDNGNDKVCCHGFTVDKNNDDNGEDDGSDNDNDIDDDRGRKNANNNINPCQDDSSNDNHGHDSPSNDYTVCNTEHISQSKAEGVPALSTDNLQQSAPCQDVVGKSPENKESRPSPTKVSSSCSLDHRLANGLIDITKPMDTATISSTTASTTTTTTTSQPTLSSSPPSLTATTPPPPPPSSSPSTSTSTSAWDTSGVESRNKPRSFSNASLDAIDPVTKRKKKRCLWLFQNMDKTTVVAFTVSSVFILSFLPFLILMFIRGLIKDFDYSLDGATLCVYHIFLRFYFLNSAINPFLYGLLNVNFRYECARTWRKFVTCFHDADKSRPKKDAAMC